jgi:hypothetical protein
VSVVVLLMDPLPERTGRLSAEVVPVTALHPTAVDEMWRVFSKYYVDVSRETFERDLSKKNDVILLVDSGDRSLQGFSTLQVYERAIDGRPFIAVFSGDTILEEAYWGQTALQKAFVRYVVMVKLRHPLRPVYWYLISKGYKTYLLLSRNFENYYPRHERPTPPFERAILDLLSRHQFGDAYVPEKGILEFSTCMGRLKPGVAPIDTGLLERPDIRFFVTKNPGHAKGDELCCLGAVDLGLVTRFTSRLADKWAERVSRKMKRLWASAGASS